MSRQSEKGRHAINQPTDPYLPLTHPVCGRKLAPEFDRLRLSKAPRSRFGNNWELLPDPTWSLKNISWKLMQTPMCPKKIYFRRADLKKIFRPFNCWQRKQKTLFACTEKLKGCGSWKMFTEGLSLLSQNRIFLSCSRIFCFVHPKLYDYEAIVVRSAQGDQIVCLIWSWIESHELSIYLLFVFFM